MINVAVCGYGTVGSGVVEILEKNKDVLKRTTGQDVELKYVLDLRDFPGTSIEKKVVHDFNIILNDESVDIVVEVMGGVNPAYSFVKSALLAGKSVCTSNKELVARHGDELIACAKSANVNFFFEASVGGGIPILRPLTECITADHVLKVSGILNGTTNYILTKMEKEGSSFDDVLKEAQALGYAERNPSADIDGFDAGRKIAILASLVCGKKVSFEDVYTEGITKITASDFVYAAKLNSTIKLIASAVFEGDNLYATVNPVMIEAGRPLSDINGVINAVCVNGDMLGDVVFVGPGAGKLPTASAVVSDVVQAIRNNGKFMNNGWSEEKKELKDISGKTSRFFVRVEGDDSRKSEITSMFGDVEFVCGLIEGEFGFLTKPLTEESFDKAYNSLKGALGRIRADVFEK